MAAKKPKSKIQTPLGMSDIMPEDQPYFQKVYKTAQNFSVFYGFKEITPPILEFTELFEKGTGQSTDIVEKQMYSLRTKGGDHLTLRPEFTPSLVRAYIEHGMQSWPQPVKLFSAGPVFRHERPQAGRFRQFYQINFEIFGSKKAIIDAEIIYLCYNFLQELGIKDLIVEINSIGDNECRSDYRRLLVRYLRKNENFLCADCRRRLKTNPLRVMDCKQERCQKIVLGAPQMIDYLCKDCHNHFKKVLEFLDDLGLPYSLNPYLVRGLDYYTRTVFEIISENKESSNQGSLIGGGRYDNLIKLFSRKNIPASGAAGGVERIISVMKEQGVTLAPAPKPALFLAQLGDRAKAKALKLIGKLKKANILVAESLDRESLTVQLRMANKLKVKYALIIGEEEVNKNSIIVRDMQTGRQSVIKMDTVVKEIRKKLKQLS